MNAWLCFFFAWLAVAVPTLYFLIKWNKRKFWTWWWLGWIPLSGMVFTSKVKDILPWAGVFAAILLLSIVLTHIKDWWDNFCQALDEFWRPPYGGDQ